MAAAILFRSVLILCLVPGFVDGLSNYYMMGRCGDELDISSYEAIELQLTTQYHYPNDEDCTLTVRTAASSDRMMLYFNSMDIEGEFSCGYDWLQLYDGTPSSYRLIGFAEKYCGSSYPSGVLTTSGDTLTLRFHSDVSTTGRGFDMIITSFHTGHCHSDEHKCSNGRCIDDGVNCNGYNPCGDYSDCTFNTAVSAGNVAGAVVGSLIAVFILVVIIVFVRRRRYSGRVVRRNVAGIATVQQTAAAVSVPPPQHLGVVQPQPPQYPQYPAPTSYSPPPPSYEEVVGNAGNFGVQPALGQNPKY